MINNPEFAESPFVSLQEMLEEREKRAQYQRQLIAKYSINGHDKSGYGPTLLCLTLNIPGPYKIFPLARRSFMEEQRITRLMLEAEGLELLHEEATDNSTGCAGYMVVRAPPEGNPRTFGPGPFGPRRRVPERVKEQALYIEETHSLGRLFDIDVIDHTGHKLSRKEARKCLVCSQPAFECGRSRAHETPALQEAVLNMMKNFFRERAGEIITTVAYKAMQYEIAVTPKPGLVDRANNGAHKDMDFFTFIDSAGAILPYFRECAIAGFDFRGEPSDLFENLRPAGKAAECLMNHATGNINTHKGLIFSFALLSTAYGILYQKNDEIEIDMVLELCRSMTSRLTEDFTKQKIKHSHGEAVYERYHIQGIRGEAAAGFPAVREHSFPVFNRMLKEGHSLNDAGIAALLSLLACVDDTNIVHRAGSSALRRIQKETAEFLKNDPSIKAMYDRADELDRQFIAQNISPGGCADLLALTFFLHFLKI